MMFGSMTFSSEALYWLTPEEREWLNSHPVISYAFDPEFAPFEYYDSEGVARGMCIDILEHLETQLGIEIEIRNIGNWSEVVQSLSDQEIDLISATPTDDRQAHMKFSNTYITIPTGMIIREGNTQLKSLDDLDGKKIATVKGWSWNEIMAEEHPEYNLIAYDTVEDALNAVIYGEVDATLQDFGTVSQHISVNKITNLKILGKYSTSLDLAYATRKDYEPFVAILNKTIPRIDDEIGEIHDNWIKLEYDTLMDSDLFVRAVSAISVVLISVLIWTLSLKAQVNKKTKALQEELERSRLMKTQIEDINEKLEQSERELRTILDADPNSIFVKDIEGRFNLVNKAAAKTLGTSVEEMLGKTMEDFSDRINVEALKHMAETEKRIFNGEINNDMYMAELNDGTGSRFIHEVKKLPIMNSDGKPRFILSVASDITELHDKNIEIENAFTALKHARAQLLEQEKWAAIGAFVAGIAHDVNTPLGASVTINSHMRKLLDNAERKYADNTLKKSDLEEFYSEFGESIQMIGGHLNRAADLIQNFKAVSVHQINEIDEEFNLCEYLNRIIKGMKFECKKRNVKISLKCSHEEVILRSAPGLISQILTNLISNSLTHGFGNNYGGHITIESHFVEDGIQLSYMDDGKGMDAQTLENVFIPFFTTKRGEGGSGLGMHIVHTLVTEKLSGRIKATSELGKGVRFDMVFPLTRTNCQGNELL